MNALKFLHIKYGSMTIKEFSTKLNSLAKYASTVANSNKGKLKVFLGGLKSKITKDMKMRDNPHKFLLEALDRALKSNVMR